jgi:hypothetical protein
MILSCIYLVEFLTGFIIKENIFISFHTCHSMVDSRDVARELVAHTCNPSYLGRD